MSTGLITMRPLAPRAVHWAVVAAVRPLHALITAPALLFIVTLTAMLFRPPDMQFGWIDRIAFLLLLFVILLRVLLLRRPVRLARPAMLPMAALLLLSLGAVLNQAYDAQNWSVLAAKWVVPFALYHAAGPVFDDDIALRKLETFLLLVLTYLSLIAILFLAGAKGLIFPRYILDESLGIHADRARGPFLQAVANGVTLNLLGLLALDCFRRRRMPILAAVLLLSMLPLAILATATRGVWLSFAGSIVFLLWLSSSPRIRRACLCMIVAAGAGLVTALIFADANSSFFARLEERSPVEFRVVMYRTGLEMFLEKPLTGWAGDDLQPELSRRVHDFRQKAFFFHNTYLEIAVQHGLLGLVLYLWVAIDLFRLGSRRRPHIASSDNSFLDEHFRSVWPILVGVYLLNGSFVVMNYQFVNGLLFTLAGILAAQNRHAGAQSHAFSN
ncbi:MAG: O-antigen ligase family protein [Terriglobales bacterium]